MSADRDVTRLVRSWIREDEHDSADRVLEIVLARLDTTPQRRSWWAARRAGTMNNAMRIALLAASVAVAAVVGLRLLPSTSGPGATPAPTATVAPEPTPRPLPFGGTIEPGRYFWSIYGVRVAFDVPAGWFSREFGLYKAPDELDEIDWGPIIRDITHVYADACKSEGALRPVGPSADDLVQALADQLGSDAEVAEIDLGGTPATRVQLAPAAGLDRAQCRFGVESPLQIWADPEETDFYALGVGYSGTVVVLDVGGTRLVFAGTAGPNARPSDVSEFNGIIASMAIEQ
jgi:hypothetical protein